MTAMRVTVLGCGGSTGVPMIGNRWGRCDPANPRNRRLRASILVEQGGAAVLVDTSPDLREQLLAAGVARLDAVVWTHVHADHCHGIDELREINRLMHRPIPVFGEAGVLEELKRRFGYCFKPLEPEVTFYYRPVLEPRVIAGPFGIDGIEVVPFEQDHGYSTSLGLRFGTFAYSTDVVRLDDRAFAALEGVDVWVVDCVREEPHPVHSHLEQTLAWIERVRPKRTILTHMGPGLDYDELRSKLPAGVEPAYDGMVIEL